MNRSIRSEYRRVARKPELRISSFWMRVFLDSRNSWTMGWEELR